MKYNLHLQLHVHSTRSFDSDVSIKEAIIYFEKNLGENEIGVLGITDHNILPFSMKEALKYCTNKVIVIPGIQWRLFKTVKDVLTKLCTRREILTLGDHDDLGEYIKNKLSLRIKKNGEISDNLTEDQMLNYLNSSKDKILIVPHPKHFIIEYYGKKEVVALKKKLEYKNIEIPFFVEEKTGYDPLPRILYSYKSKYLTTGGSDAHEIISLFKTSSFFSVVTKLEISLEDFEYIKTVGHKKDINLYKNAVSHLFNLLITQNKNIKINKYYIRSNLHFFRSLIKWAKRRFEDFPHHFFH